MTAQPIPAPGAAPEEPLHQVVAADGTRLEQLHATYAEAKAKRDAAEAEYKTITDGIKAELGQVIADGETAVELRGEAGPSLRLVWVESWRLDSTKLKAEQPETWVRYAKKGGSWTLKVVS